MSSPLHDGCVRAVCRDALEAVVPQIKRLAEIEAKSQQRNAEGSNSFK
jgi:hypothetical protein